jgi:biofilm PGA synthesis protein PgaD
MKAQLIIQNRKQPKLQKTIMGTLTLFAWIFFFYLFMPLITLLLWFMGVKTAYIEIYQRNNSFDTVLLYTLPAIALVCGIILLLWAEVNRYRFSGEDRRTAPEDVTLEDMARTLNAPIGVARKMQSSKITVLKMDDSANPYQAQNVEVGHELSMECRCHQKRCSVCQTEFALETAA